MNEMKSGGDSSGGDSSGGSSGGMEGRGGVAGAGVAGAGVAGSAGGGTVGAGGSGFGGKASDPAAAPAALAAGDRTGGGAGGAGGRSSWDELVTRLDELARTPVLLVASDFDGTIAPIVSRPEEAEADRESLAALRALSGMPQTHVALVSGRALADLAARTPDAGKLLLVGSHGSEFEPGVGRPLDPAAVELLERLARALDEVAATTPGVLVERKPTSLAFHYRNAEEAAGAAAAERVLGGPAKWPGVHLRHGKKVLELSVVETNKGMALAILRQRLGATAAIFLGDDVTDEDAFRVLLGPDVAVKVGPGPSVASYRAESTTAVARVLAYLAERRREWLAGAEAVPIEQHSLLSDQRTVALVSPDARIVWMCLPRIDSSAFFAELIGGPRCGYFAIGPVPFSRPAARHYVGDSMVLRSVWPGMSVTDYLDAGGGRAYQRAGRTDLIRVIEGRGRVWVEFAPRLDFGRNETRLRAVDGGIVVEGALEPMVLRAPGIAWTIRDDGRHQTACAEFELNGNNGGNGGGGGGSGAVVLELRFGTASLAEDALPEPARRRRVEHFWSGWAATLQLPKLARDLVRRSAVVLKALIYGPSGAIAAAATTSLPEHAGGVRNWDYRFCWPRDAALSAAALVELGATGPAIKLLDWVLNILDQAEPGSLLRPVYTVNGGHLGPEADLAELPGYRGSRPVRIGNAAAHQVQLDVFGPIAELMALLADRGAALSSEHWRLIEGMVRSVEQRWQEPDHGIWEVRLSRRHHVHSKVMCWQTVDRAMHVAKYLGRPHPEWEELRDRIAAEVLERGWKPSVRSFCATYDDHEPDASTLAVGLSGLLRPDDERFLGTLAYVERNLRAGPVVYRYKYDDGLPGIEGGFLLCNSWLIEAYALAGRLDKAMELFERTVALAGPTGLFTEEFDPVSGYALGNFPQAFSHLGLIRAAVRLDKLTNDPSRGGA